MSTISGRQIDRSTGEIHLTRYIEVAETIENESAQLTLAQAKKKKPDAEIGDEFIDPLPPIDFGRIAAQTAKQVIVQRVRDAEGQRQFDEFKDRTSEIVNGLVSASSSAMWWSIWAAPRRCCAATS